MRDIQNERMARVAEVVDLWRMGQLAAEDAIRKVRSETDEPAERPYWGGEGEIYDKGLG